MSEETPMGASKTPFIPLGMEGVLLSWHTRFARGVFGLRAAYVR